jgi:hypothetical protein
MNGLFQSLVTRNFLVAYAGAFLALGSAACRQRDDGMSAQRALQAVIPEEHSVGSFTLPAKEVSGLCVYKDPATGLKKILAINDTDKKLLVMDFDELTRGSLKFESLDLSSWKGSPKPNGSVKSGSQWEAIYADNLGRIYISNEEAATIEVFDFKHQQMLGQIELAFKPDDEQFSELKKAWDQDPGSRIEGFTVLPNGHILAVKEKNPPALMEFVPQGQSAQGVSASSLKASSEEEQPSKFVSWPGVPEKKLTYYARKVWRPSSEFHEDLDLSEIAITPDGQMALLSDRMRAIYFIGDTLTLNETTFKRRKTVSLPLEMEKPEGLTFIGLDRALIAIDLKEIKANLYLKHLK